VGDCENAGVTKRMDKTTIRNNTLRDWDWFFRLKLVFILKFLMAKAFYRNSSALFTGLKPRCKKAHSKTNSGETKPQSTGIWITALIFYFTTYLV
jgi:hypothetical protein